MKNFVEFWLAKALADLVILAIIVAIPAGLIAILVVSDRIRKICKGWQR